MEQGLSLGKQITIPLNKSNFVQSKDAASSTGLRPVYHHVGEKETLYRISLRYGKVPLDNVREWNKFAGDGVKKDAMLIVGYVKGSSNSIVQTAPVSQPVATTATPAPVATTPAPVATTPAPVQESAGTTPAVSEATIPGPG